MSLWRGGVGCGDVVSQCDCVEVLASMLIVFCGCVDVGKFDVLELLLKSGCIKSKKTLRIGANSQFRSACTEALRGKVQEKRWKI